MTQYISEFNAYLEKSKNCSDTTLKAYTADVTEYLEYISSSLQKTALQAAKADTESYVEYLKNCGRSVSTINRKLASVRCYYNFLQSIGKIKKNPTEGIKTARVQKTEIDYLTIEEVELLLAQPDDSVKGIRDRALLEMMYATGMRAGEICAADIGDLNLTIGYVSCFGENTRPRMIPLGRPAKAAIISYINDGSRKTLLADRDDDGTLFLNILGERMTRQGVWKILKYYGEKAGLESKISPQILRNSFAAHMIMNGADLKSLQELLGHEDITATKLFLSLTKNRILDVYDRTFPRAK